MYQDEINRAVKAYPDKWWAAEELRDELYHYWITTSQKISDGLNPSPSRSEYAYMDEDEADIYREIHSPTDDSSDFYARQNEKARHADFARRADADELLQACFCGWAYEIKPEEWVKKEKWSMTGYNDDQPDVEIYTDSEDLKDLIFEVDLCAEDIAGNAFDCSDTLLHVKWLCEKFAKLPQEQQIRFAMKLLVREALKRRPEMRKNAMEATLRMIERLEKELEKPSKISELKQANSDELHY